MAVHKLLFVCFVCSFLCLSYQQGPDIEEIRQRIDQFVNDLLDCYDIPGAIVAAVREGQVITAKGYGIRNLETQEPTREQDLFVIASVTKQFVGTVVGEVLYRHNLTWDTPVRNILGDWFYWKDPYRTAKVTVRDTLAHRTGLPGHNVMRTYGFTIRELFERTRFLDTTAAIRSEYMYNNLMYGLAGYVAQTLEGGKSWEDLAREIIFEPLGMNDTTFVQLSRDRWSDYATVYRFDDLFLPREVSLEHPALFYRTISAPGGIASTAADMARWMMAFLSEGRNQQGVQVLNPQVLQDIRAISMPVGGPPSYLRPDEPVTMAMSEAYGMGLLRGYHRGYSLVNHGGAQVFLSLLSMLPDMNIGVFCSINLELFSSFDTNIHAYIMDLLLGYEPFLNSTTACPEEIYGSSDLDKLFDDYNDYESVQLQPSAGKRVRKPGLYDEANTVGVYTDHAYGTLVVYRNSTDDELYMSYGDRVRWRLINQGDDVTYEGEGQEPYWSFNVAEVLFNGCDSQPCESVRVSFEAASPPTFHRIPEQAPLPSPPCPSG